MSRAQSTLSGWLLLFLASVVIEPAGATTEQWRDVPMPPGFRVHPTELDGPVFTDERGRTLYMWPQRVLRNGYSGETPGKPACFDRVRTVTAGLMSPYPPGIRLPELDNRPSCTDLWPPAIADEGSTPVGDWTLVDRPDGQRQWMYKEQPLYTSVRDAQAGEVYGGSTRRRTGGSVDRDSPVYRVPIGPPTLLPPGFAVKTTAAGRMLGTDSSYAVYAFDADSPDRIACRDACLEKWTPVLAAELSRPIGEWSIVARDPGVRQWAFRGKPLYTYRLEARLSRQNWKQTGSDEPGWRNVFTQKAPQAPAEFTVQPTLSGEVLADARGRTLYEYRCADDSQDQLSCNHPEDTQVYRLAICGGGDASLCQKRWPYVAAADSAVSLSNTWKVRWINPSTGRYTGEEAPGALRIWTYRDRPIYTYYLDERPGDIHGAGIGEWRGKRNGLLAMWVRNDLMRGVAE